MSKPLDIEWRRIGIEALAIVISILLAFWIDAWWEERNERASFVAQLKAFDTELADNSIKLGTSINVTSARVLDLTKVFDAIASTEEIPNETYEQLGRALWYDYNSVSTSVYQELINFGTLRQINDKKLLSAISSYDQLASNLSESFANSAAYYRDRISPVLIQHVSLTDLGWHTYESMPGKDGVPISISPPATPFPVDKDELRNLEVWNALYEWQTSQMDFLIALYDTKTAIDNVRSLLAEELAELE